MKYILKTTPYDELVAIFKELKELLDGETGTASVSIPESGLSEPDRSMSSDLECGNTNTGRAGDGEVERRTRAVISGSLDGERRPDIREEFQDDKILTVMKQYIDAHLESVSLDVLAEQVYMSPAYVSRYFKQKTGQNFQEYLIAKRMERAAALLEDLRYQIGDVSEMVGYRNPFNFSRTFKKYYGVNPREYRVRRPDFHTAENHGGRK